MNEDNKANKIYYNIVIPHDDSKSINGSPTEANFFEVRTNNLFNGSPKDYYLSVIRFTIPSGYIPLLFFPVTTDPNLLPNETNPNYGIYTVTLSYNGNDYQTHLQYVPQNSYIQVPPDPLPTDPPQRPQYINYYSVYSIQWFLDILNKALSTSFTNLKSAFPAAPPTYAPFMTFDNSTKLFTLYAQSGYITGVPGNVDIFINTSLSGLFETSFNTKYYGYQNITNGKNQQFIIKDLITNNSTIAPYGILYYSNQEYSTISQWLPFTNITFTSISLPFRSEWTSGGVIRDSGNSSNKFRSIVTDFEIDNFSGFETRSFIHYVPTAEYRRIDLIGDTPIRTVDIQVYWKDNYDNFYPILIPAHSELTIKMLFERKK